MSKKDLKFLLISFFTWRVFLFILLFFAITVIPLQMNFLGGGLSNYLSKPYLWSWLNFDGEHYLSIAYRGYQPLTYFYFPALPLITRLVASLFNQSFTSLAAWGLLVSHASFLLVLFGLWKLIRLDFERPVASFAIMLLLFFPTSFYFASFYTESLFLAFAVWTFYFARKTMWLYSGILGAFATATRVVGIALFPAMLVELWLQRKGRKRTSLLAPLFGLILIPLGLFTYMYYLKSATGDPLEFFHTVSIFGQQRSSGLILLPQVFYRYVFKILPSVNYSYFPTVFTTLLEFSVGSIFSLLSIFAFFRLRLSYTTYLLVGFLIPTLSGSFSSLPRYVLVLFPAYILVAEYLYPKTKSLKVLVLGLLFILLCIATSLFVRGFWIA